MDDPAAAVRIWPEEVILSGPRFFSLIVFGRINLKIFFFFEKSNARSDRSPFTRPISDQLTPDHGPDQNLGPPYQFVPVQLFGPIIRGTTQFLKIYKILIFQ